MNDSNSGDLLLAEDSVTDAEMTQRALRKANLANPVRWVKDGAAALDFLFCRGEYASRDPREIPKLVLVDLKMPKVDGLEVLRQMRSNPALKCVPVVMLTSSREEADLARSYNLGVNAYVVKPIEFQAFVAAVKTLGVFWALINEVPWSAAARSTEAGE